MSECGGCNGEPIKVGNSGAYDLTQFDMPKVFHAQYQVEGHPLQALRFTLPPHDGVQRKFQRPFFHNNGSIEYPRLAGDSEPPAEIDGYTRDPNNAWLFLPLWPACSDRFQGTKLSKSGCIEVHMLCDSPQAPTYQKQVNYAACQACPHKNSPAS